MRKVGREKVEEEKFKEDEEEKVAKKTVEEGEDG